MTFASAAKGEGGNGWGKAGNGGKDEGGGAGGGGGHLVLLLLWLEDLLVLDELLLDQKVVFHPLQLQISQTALRRRNNCANGYYFCGGGESKFWVRSSFRQQQQLGNQRHAHAHPLAALWLTPRPASCVFVLLGWLPSTRTSFFLAASLCHRRLCQEAPARRHFRLCRGNTLGDSQRCWGLSYWMADVSNTLSEEIYGIRGSTWLVPHYFVSSIFPGELVRFVS